MLQSTSHKYSRANVSAACKCCGLYDEDLAHMLLECPAFIHQRKPIYSQFKTKVINCVGAQHWRELFNNRDSLVKLILDCSRYSIIKEKPECRELLNTRLNIQTSHHKNKHAVVGVVSSVLTVLPVFIEETVYSVHVHGFYKYALLYKLLKKL